MLKVCGQSYKLLSSGVFNNRYAYCYSVQEILDNCSLPTMKQELDEGPFCAQGQLHMDMN